MRPRSIASMPLCRGWGALMELGDHGFSKKFGWVSDRFGVSWQLNLAA
ncbi:VOC family protein [Kibdelosporangium philippinense]